MCRRAAAAAPDHAPRARCSKSLTRAAPRPEGIIADEPEEHSLVAEFGMDYKSPEIAPLAQPANLLEATTGEATTGAGAPTGGAPAGTAMPMEDLAGAVARGAAGAAAIGAARAGTASAAPAGAGAATGAGAAPAARQAIANFAAAL